LPGHVPVAVAAPAMPTLGAAVQELLQGSEWPKGIIDPVSLVASTTAHLGQQQRLFAWGSIRWDVWEESAQIIPEALLII
jgi:hypothetical protein